jgi:hypothetical protein
MFKKSLLALALSTVAVSATAATLTTGAGNGVSAGNIGVIGKEYVAAGTAGVTVSNIVVTLGA